MRRRVDVPIAADESIRRAADPMAVSGLGAADIAVLKVQPIGGRACLPAHRRADRPAGRRVAARWRPRSASPPESRSPPRCPSCRTPAGWQRSLLEPTTWCAARWCPSTGCSPVSRPVVDRDRYAVAAADGPTADRWRTRRVRRRRRCWPVRGERVDAARPDARRRAVPAGVREAVLAPGSRSAPLAFALHAADAEGRIRMHVRLDERTAGFLALGLAKQLQSPGRGRDHVGHRGRQPPPGGARGVPRRGAAGGAVGRPAGGAARHRRQPDDRPGEDLRRCGPVVRPAAVRDRLGGGSRRCRPGAVGGSRYAYVRTRTGPPQRRVAGPARPRIRRLAG